MKKLLAFALSLFFVYGCGTLSKSTKSVCIDIPEGASSVICEVANELDVSPEYVDYLLKIGNVTALAADTYTAHSALEFVEQLELFLTEAQKQGLTYAVVAGFARDKFKELPPKVQIAFVVLQEFVEPPEVYAQKPLTDYDYTILQAGLKAQYSIIRPFLVAD